MAKNSKKSNSQKETIWEFEQRLKSEAKEVLRIAKEQEKLK